jgi:hypothetical protein
MRYPNRGLYYLRLLLLLAPAGIAAADELPSYQQSLNQYIETGACCTGFLSGCMVSFLQHALARIAAEPARVYKI